MKSRHSLAMALLIFTMFVCGCSSRTEQPLEPITKFNPQQDTFDFQVVLFDLNNKGFPEKLESGTVPIEKSVITVLEAAGYKYNPGPDANYVIEARLGSLDPRLAILPEEQQVDFIDGLDWDIPDFNEYPAIVETWSPEIQRIRSGPVACILTTQIVIRNQQNGTSRIVYRNSPLPRATSYVMGCPYNAAQDKSIQMLKENLLKIFVR